MSHCQISKVVPPRQSPRPGLRQLLNLRVLAVFTVASVLLAVVGWQSYKLVRQSVRTQVQMLLGTLLKADVQELSVWLELERSTAARLAADSEVEDLVRQLATVEQSGAASRRALLETSAQSSLRELLGALSRPRDLFDFAVTDAGGRVIAAERDAEVGTISPPARRDFMQEVMRGRAIIAQSSPVEGSPQPIRLLVGALVRDDAGVPLAVLSFEIRPEVSFPKLLGAGGAALHADTLVFDRTGAIVAGLGQGRRFPRFDAADPSAQDGAQVEDYFDAAGREVAGIWAWLPDFQLGAATQMEASHAYRALALLQRAFGLLFGLLVLSTLGVMLASFALLVWRSRAKRALLEARQLGPYVLEERIGRGGMGEVYRARHRLLRRPTAVKLIRPDSVTAEMLQQFEREVQLTSRLRHPNTIAIYDFGRSPDNIFYYAMEFLTGVTLKQLAADYGPQPEGRVIHVLQGISASLEEAHGIWLIHRDIKPANVMLCYLGGVCDMVKVLDFGLVTEASQSKTGNGGGVLLGSIRFAAPEVLGGGAIDARSDIYSVGAVAYYLLTGQYVFSAKADAEYRTAVLHQDAEAPSRRLGRAVPSDLEELIMSCLSRDADRRPQSAAQLGRTLERCRHAGAWTPEAAQAWWTEFGKRYKFGKFVDAVAELASTAAADAPRTVHAAQRD